MNVYDLIMTRRTIRKFTQKPIERDLMVKLIDAARMAPTAANAQPLSFGIITEKGLCDQIFPLLGWARYLNGTYTPTESERPTAYIAVFIDGEKSNFTETAAGSAVENLLLMAHSQGLGSCWLGAVDRVKVLELLGTPENKQLLYIIALGYPSESPGVVDYTDDIKYYLDEQKVLQVPKKTFKDVVSIDR